MSHGGDDGLPAEEHEEHVNHEAWVIPYADLLTLLMAMFIALFAMSTVDIDKFKELSIGFNEALGGGDLSTGVFDHDAGGDGPLDGTGSGVAAQPGGALGPDRQPVSNSVLEKLLSQYEHRQVAQSVERESLRGVADAIEREVAGTPYVRSLRVRLEERGLVVTVVTDEVLFDSGAAQLRSDALPILRIVGEALGDVENAVVVEGHTDSRPISTARFPSNWELSGARAAAVVRYLERAGVRSSRLSYEGYGERLPIASNDTPAGRAQNRRVEIVVKSMLIEQTLDDAGLGDDPVGAPPDPVDGRVDGGIDPIRPHLGAG
jgi:chemotaxis protein MotB